MTDTMAGLTDIFENPFDFDDPRIEVARVLTRTEAKAVLEFSGDIVQILAAQPSAGAQVDPYVERMAAEADAVLYGTGFMVDGVRIDPSRMKIIATPAQPDTGAVEALREVEADIRKLCNGHPHAKIEWPHRDLHAIADRLAAITGTKSNGGH